MSVRSYGDDVPLGSLLLGRGDATIAVLAELTLYSYRWPWTVPCLVLPADANSLEPLLMLVTELRDRLVLVSNACDRCGDELTHTIACVRQRVLPTPAALARWVARRLGDRELEPALRHQFAEALGGTPAEASLSVAGYSRLFSHYGKYTARDWRALGRLSLHVDPGTVGDDVGARLPRRTTSEYAKKYLGVPYGVLAERLGWEWVLEAALRTGGYRCPSRSAPPAPSGPTITRRCTWGARHQEVSNGAPAPLSPH